MSSDARTRAPDGALALWEEKLSTSSLCGAGSPVRLTHANGVIEVQYRDAWKTVLSSVGFTLLFVQNNIFYTYSERCV
jgi:hypothetical protein